MTFELGLALLRTNTSFNVDLVMSDYFERIKRVHLSQLPLGVIVLIAVLLIVAIWEAFVIATTSSVGLPIAVPSIANAMSPMNKTSFDSCLGQWNNPSSHYPATGPILFDFRCVTETGKAEFAYFHVIR